MQPCLAVHVLQVPSSLSGLAGAASDARMGTAGSKEGAVPMHEHARAGLVQGKRLLSISRKPSKMLVMLASAGSNPVLPMQAMQVAAASCVSCATQAGCRSITCSTAGLLSQCWCGCCCMLHLRTFDGLCRMKHLLLA